MESSIDSPKESCVGINSAKSERAVGRPTNTRARSRTTASASSAIAQVKRSPLRKTWPSPSWFFSKDCAGSIQGRTCCQPAAPSDWPTAADPAGSRVAQADRRIVSGNAPLPNIGHTVPGWLPFRTNVRQPSHRSPTKPAARLAGRRPDSTRHKERLISYRYAVWSGPPRASARDTGALVSAAK